MTSGTQRAATPLTALKRVAAARRRADAVERCEFCSERITERHNHVVNLGDHVLLCVCRACYLLFMTRGAARGMFLSVPERYLMIPAARFDATTLEMLGVPVDVACFFRNSALGRTVALYPSPAGATESLPPPEVWAAIADENPAIAEIAADVEALLVRKAGTRLECYIVPIDACYELVGLLRREWRGFGGGEEAWRAIGEFFARIRALSGVHEVAGG